MQQEFVGKLTITCVLPSQGDIALKVLKEVNFSLVEP